MGRPRLVPLALVMVHAAFLAACSGDPTNVQLSVDAPLQVKVGEQFQVKAHITNTGQKQQTLRDLDVGDRYLEGIAITKTDPLFRDTMHVPLDNSISYSFDLELPSNQEMVVTFYATALKAGDFSSRIDFCINSRGSYLSYPLRTRVTEAKK